MIALTIILILGFGFLMLVVEEGLARITHALERIAKELELL